MRKTKIDNNDKNQYRSILICWIAYVSVYFGRYSYSANIALIEDFYGKTHAEAGLVMTYFSIAYGIGQFINGIFCKRYPRRYVIPFALMISSIMDILVYCGIPFYMIKYLWLIGAVCQSVLWPMIMQVISENVSGKLMHKAILIMSTSTAFGTLGIYGMSAALAKANFKLTFLVGAIILIISASIWFLFYKKGNYLFEYKTEKKRNENRDRRIGYALLAPIALFVLFSVITNFAKDGLQTWMPVILKKLHEMPDNLSILLTLVLPLFGIFGSVFAVVMNRKIKKIIPLTMMFFLLVAAFETIVIIFQASLVITLVALGVLELLLHGISNILSSIFPLRMREEISSGTLAGILNGSAYVGSAASSYVFGKIADISGWNAVFIILLGAVCSALVFGTIYWLLASKKEALEV